MVRTCFLCIMRFITMQAESRFDSGTSHTLSVLFFLNFYQASTYVFLANATAFNDSFHSLRILTPPPSKSEFNFQFRTCSNSLPSDIPGLVSHPASNRSDSQYTGPPLELPDRLVAVGPHLLSIRARENVMQQAESGSIPGRVMGAFLRFFCIL
jgi:hypothetical protein